MWRLLSRVPAVASSAPRAAAIRVTAVPMSTEAARVAGNCKWFNVTKGFGFIETEESDQDYFVHQSEIHAPGFRSLAEGEPVRAPASKGAHLGRSSLVPADVCAQTR